MRAATRPRDAGGASRNVVFMGMGEPWPTSAPSGQRSSGSTTTSAVGAPASRSRRSGIVPGIRTLADRPLPVNLAVSLHAANDELRDELVPINRRYPLDD